FAVVGVVILIDLTRAIVSWRAANRYSSAALQSNALHFASDLVGSVAVLVGLILARAGHPKADPVAALVVAVIVLLAAARLMRRNIDVLMDRAPAEATAAARQAIERNVPGVSLRRLRLRQAAGRHFVDVVIGVPPGAAVAQGHAAADDVEDAGARAPPRAMRRPTTSRTRWAGRSPSRTWSSMSSRSQARRPRSANGYRRPRSRLSRS